MKLKNKLLLGVSTLSLSMGALGMESYLDLSSEKQISTKNHGQINFKNIYKDVIDKKTYTQKKNRCTPNSVAAALSYVHGEAYMNSGFIYNRSLANSSIDAGQLPIAAMNSALNSGTYKMNDSEYLHNDDGSGPRYAFMHIKHLYQGFGGGQLGVNPNNHNPVRVLKDSLNEYRAPVVYTYYTTDKFTSMHSVAVYGYNGDSFDALCSSRGGTIKIDFDKVNRDTICAYVGWGAGIITADFQTIDAVTQGTSNTIQASRNAITSGLLGNTAVGRSANVWLEERDGAALQLNPSKIDWGLTGREIVRKTGEGCTIF